MLDYGLRREKRVYLFLPFFPERPPGEFLASSRRRVHEALTVTKPIQLEVTVGTSLNLLFMNEDKVQVFSRSAYYSEAYGSALAVGACAP